MEAFVEWAELVMGKKSFENTQNVVGVSLKWGIGQWKYVYVN